MAICPIIDMKDRIKQLMESQKMTQKEFASELCIAEGTLSSVFTGRTKPTNNIVSAIHERFPEVSIPWLMFGEGDMLASSQNEALQKSVTEDKQAGSSDGSVQQDMFSTAPSMRTIDHPVQEIVKYIDRAPRKITEIRVFYDDGTFETFKA